MKKVVFVWIFSLFILNQIFAQITVFKPQENVKSTFFQLKDNHYQGFDLSFYLGETKASKKPVDIGTFYELQADGLYPALGNGEPMLPHFSRLIQVPFGAKVKVKVVSSKSKTVNLHDLGIDYPLLPARPSIRKDMDTVFTIDKQIYGQNRYFAKPLAVYEEAGIKRDVRYGRLVINPFQYNPVTGDLTIYYQLQVKVDFVNPDIKKTEEIRNKYALPGEQLLSKVINTLDERKALGVPSVFPLTYLVLVPAEFKDDAVFQSFLEWKRQQGYNVLVGVVGEDVAADAADIKSWIQNIYNNPPAGYNPPAYLLIIGDVDKVPSHQYSEITDSPYSDLYYVDFTSDYRPELDFGRISADNTTELEGALNKILYYEREQFAADYSHLKQVLMVPGDDENYEDKWGNGQIYYGVTNYFNASHGIYSHTFYQDPEDNGVPGGNAAVHDSIIADVNAGIGFANYTAHCSPDGWAAPSFSQADLAGLTNYNKYGFWIGNCCQSYKFDEEDAFGEKALYIADKGAAAYIGGSQYTYWDEDYWWGVGYGEVVSQPTYSSTGRGAYDAMFHDLSNEVNSPQVWALSVRQAVDAGNLAVDESGSSLSNYYWCIYQVSGDPSMITRLGNIQNITVDLDPPVVGSKTVSGTTLPYTFIGITADNTLIGAGVADASGNFSIDLASPLEAVNLHFVLYGQNKTVTETDFFPIVPDKPYLLVNKVQPDTVATGTTNAFGFTVVNLNDSLGADSVYVKLSSPDTLLTFLQDSLWIGQVNGGDTLVFTNAFQAIVNLAPEDLTKTKINFDIQGVYNDTAYNWNSERTIVIRTPVLSVESAYFADPGQNGYLDLGEYDTLIVVLKNQGVVDANNTVVTLNTDNSDVQVVPSQTVDIPAGSEVYVKFPVFVPDTAADGVKTSFAVKALCQIYSASTDIMRWVGVPAEIYVGDGSLTGIKYPLYNYYENEHTQMLYRNDLLGGRTLITAIGFQIDKGNDWNFYNFKVRMRNVTEDDLGAEFISDDGMVEVFSMDTLAYKSVDAGTYYILNLQHPFYYDGTSNILVDVTWGDNGQYPFSSNSIYCMGTELDYSCVAYGLADDELPQTPGFATKNIVNTKFEFKNSTQGLVVVKNPVLDTVNVNSTVSLSLDLLNIGESEITADTVILYPLSGDVTILDSVYVIKNLLPDQQVTVDSAFKIQIGDLPNNSKIKLYAESNGVRQSVILIVKAPDIRLKDVALASGNTYLDGNATDQLNAVIVNQGLLPAGNLVVTAKTGQTFLTLQADTLKVPSLNPGDSVVFSVPVEAADIDTSAKAVITFEISYDDKNITRTYDLWVNEPLEQWFGDSTGVVFEYPFYQYYQGEKTQMLFLSSEFSKLPVQIGSFGVYIPSFDGDVMTLNNFRINIFTTGSTQVGDFIPDGNDKITVFSANYQPVKGWNIFDFDTAFNYHGDGDLVVEIIWGLNNTYISDHIYTTVTNTDFTSVWYGYDDNNTPPGLVGTSTARPVAYMGYTNQEVSNIDNNLDYVKVGPNPTSNTLFIDNASAATLTLSDVTGKVVLRKNLVSSRETIDLSGLLPGIYMVTLRTESSVRTFKVIKN